MKLIYITLLIILFIGCKNDNRQDIPNEVDKNEQFEVIGDDTSYVANKDIKALDKAISIEIKQQDLIKKKDERDELEQLIIDEKYVLNTKDFTINFSYPMLNESLNPKNRNFNDFIKNYYVNVTDALSEIQESKALCDNIASKKFREDRFINYKIYNVNDQVVSVLFYKENFYSGAMHPTYSFDCFNFNLNKGVFMTYEDFFVPGTEDELLSIINEKINEKIQEGELYYDCWAIDSSDFFSSKNNFVLNDTNMEFYFDDCVMCPSYTGTYSIELSLLELQPVLRKSNSNQLIF